MMRDYIDRNKVLGCSYLIDGVEVVEAEDIKRLKNIEVETKEPIGVRCFEDCYWVRMDWGDDVTPPSGECGKNDEEFEQINIEPMFTKRDKVVCPDCPFYINYETIKQMESEYHKEEEDTHGDEIRSMSNAELAGWITAIVNHFNPENVHHVVEWIMAER